MTPSFAAEQLPPGPLLIVGSDVLMQTRLRSLLMLLGYPREALLIASGLVQARAVQASQPCTLMLIDIDLPDGSGIALIAETHARDPALRMLALSEWGTETAIVSALRAGAVGYVLKERDDIEIALSIRSMLRGGAPIDPFVMHRVLHTALPELVQDGEQRDGVEIPLSRREIEVLGLVSKGLTNREIAEALFLSRWTVEGHIKAIYRKLFVSSRTKAVFVARTRGLLP